MTRDRDPAGRPRNARPRDALGRPLSPGQAGDEARIADDLTLPPAATLRLADELLSNGRPFHAHEVFEAAWKTGPAAERDLWQGLAQVAVGLTHAHRGNARGAITLIRRGTARMRGYQGDVRQYGFDLDLFAAAADKLAADIERDGLEDADLRLRLLPG